MSAKLTPAMKRSFLIAALRDRSMWPKDFEWDFRSCTTCGIGLMFSLMKTPLPNHTIYPIAEELGIAPLDALTVFGSTGYRDCLVVTPAMVADKLEVLHHQL